MIEQVLFEVLKLAPEELPILLSAVAALVEAFKAGQTREQAVEAARAAVRAGVDAYEAAAVSKP